MNSQQDRPPEEDPESKFPDRKQDLDHRELQAYMEKHHIRQMFAQMIAYLVEKRSEDTLVGALEFLDKYQPPTSQ